MSAPISTPPPLPPPPPSPAGPLGYEDRPTVPFVLSLIGGILVTLVSAFFLTVGFGYNAYPAGPLGLNFGVFSVIGLVCGVLLVGYATLLYVVPAHHVVYGVLIVIFSMVSLVNFGGFYIGFVLALIGGVLGIVWRPHAWPMGASCASSGYAAYAAPMGAWVCLRCGRVSYAQFRFCPFCGNPAVP